MYNVKADLQRTADAAALAAAQELGVAGDGLATQRAFTVAQDFAERNPTLIGDVQLASSDVSFGSAWIDPATGRYVFEQGTEFPNAIRVEARRTENAPSGPVPLMFAQVFGIRSTNIAARATAILTPRDIVFVLDLSSSHNDDSSLRSYRNIEIDNRPVWEKLFDQTVREQPLEDGFASGPVFGNMNDWGMASTGPDWQYASDPGLTYLPRNKKWGLTSEWASQTLVSNGHSSYTASEMVAINASSYDADVASYRRRVLVGLGIYRWKSGLAGGQPGGNGDSRIDASEVQTMVPWPSSTTNPATACKKVGGSWTEFVDYVASSASSMCRYDPDSQLYGNPNLRYRYGLKTWVDFLQEKENTDSQSPGLAGTPQQPMQAVADGVLESLNIIEDLDSSDLVGLASYATYGYGPAEKPGQMAWLTDDLASLRSNVAMLHPGMWTSTTNIAQGIDKGVEVLLNSPRARPNAAKIMILLTDGKANQTRANPTQYYDELCTSCPPREDARDAAGDARRQGIRIYTVSVGANADIPLMQAIAEIGSGRHSHAQGSIESYRQQLQEIFRDLGNRRPVVLIQ